MIILYLLAFLACLSLSLAATFFVRKFAHELGWVEAPKLDRHVHTVAVPRIGGVAIVGSFTIVVTVALLIFRWTGIASLIPARPILDLLAPALIVFLLGLYDDLKNIAAGWKFGVEAIAAIILSMGGFGIHNLHFVLGGHELSAAIALPLTVFWVLLITNAFNLIDGLDGLAAGSALFSVLVVFCISLIVPNPLVTFLAIALAGSILGFLKFNFHPATIFLGDSGSLFIGFMLSVLALAGSQKAPTMVAVAIPLLSLGLPILDVTLAVARRFLVRRSLFSSDGDHIHHKLLKRGFSQRDAVLILYAATAAFGFLSLILLQERRVIALVLAVTGIGVFLGVQQLRYQEFAELISVVQNVTRRRQILANHVAIRRATESLKACTEFDSICEILRDTLQPIGFDGIRLHKLGDTGFSGLTFDALHPRPIENLLQSWSSEEMSEAPWELRLELYNSSRHKWGYVSLTRLSDRAVLPLDINVLTGDFRQSLSDAVAKVSLQIPPELHKVPKIKRLKRRFARAH